MARMETRDLSVSYSGNLVLDSVSLEIKERQITALIGPSGCGKSTFLRCLNRMNDEISTASVEGQVLLDGVDINAPDYDVVALRQRVGMLFQRPNPFPKSVFDNVAYGPRILGNGKRQDLEVVVESSLRGVGLWDEVKDELSGPALRLSLGQQQRLCLARSLAVKPEVILMDEPASALDPISTLKIEELMRELANEYTIVIVTHSMLQAGRISDWTGFFLTEDGQVGRLVEYGATPQVFTNPRDERTEGYITGRFG